MFCVCVSVFNTVNLCPGCWKLERYTNLKKVFILGKLYQRMVLSIMVNIISFNLLVFKVIVVIRMALILFDNARQLVESALYLCMDLMGPLSLPSRFTERGSIDLIRLHLCCWHHNIASRHLEKCCYSLVSKNKFWGNREPQSAFKDLNLLLRPGFFRHTCLTKNCRKE